MGNCCGATENFGSKYPQISNRTDFFDAMGSFSDSEDILGDLTTDFSICEDIESPKIPKI